MLKIAPNVYSSSPLRFRLAQVFQSFKKRASIRRPLVAIGRMRGARVRTSSGARATLPMTQLQIRFAQLSFNIAMMEVEVV